MILGWLVLPDQQKLWVGHASVLVNIQLRDTLLGFRHLKCKMFLHELYYWNALHKQWSSCRQKLVKAEVWRWKATLRQRAKSGRSSAAGASVRMVAGVRNSRDCATQQLWQLPSQLKMLLINIQSALDCFFLLSAHA